MVVKFCICPELPEMIGVAKRMARLCKHRVHRIRIVYHRSFVPWQDPDIVRRLLSAGTMKPVSCGLGSRSHMHPLVFPFTRRLVSSTCNVLEVSNAVSISLIAASTTGCHRLVMFTTVPALIEWSASALTISVTRSFQSPFSF